MFGECHAHIIMDGVNYRHAVDMHKNGPDDKIIREHLKAYKERGIVIVRDGGDALGVSEFLPGSGNCFCMGWRCCAGCFCESE